MYQDDKRDDVIEGFFAKIDGWINDNKLNIKRVDTDECEAAMNLSFDQLEEMSPADLLKNGYILYGYADYISSAHNSEKMIYEYADNSINYILAQQFNNYGDQYTKWDIKYNSAVKENPMAKKLNTLKNNAKARLTLLECRAEHIKKMGDIMIELSRKKKNEHY